MSALLRLVETDRVCKDCELSKPIADFQKSGINGAYRLHRCTPCQRGKEANRARERWKNDPDYRAKRRASAKVAYQTYPQRHGEKRPSGKPHTREYYVRRLCGVSLDHVQKAFDQQLGLCANRACGIEISWTAPKGSRNRAVIDHDHKTGKFRAILCHPCNILLGHVDKSKNRILGLFEYAMKHA